MCTKDKVVILYPGSFNPVHIGHTALASYTLEHIGADELWFVPSPQNPIKSVQDTKPIKERIDIISQSIKSEKRFAVCDIEKHLAKPYYSIRTLRALEAIYPNIEFIILLGADSILSIDKWFNGLYIMKHYSIVVYPRKGYDMNMFKKYKNICILNEAPYISISSTMIREAKKQGKQLRYFLPKAELWDMI